MEEEKELTGQTETAEFEHFGEYIEEPETPEVAASESVPEEPESEPEDHEEAPSKIMFAGKEYSSIEEAEEYFANRESLYGKQANELGELRQKLQPKEEKVEYDPYDKESVDRYIEHKGQQVAQNAIKQITQVQEFERTVGQLQKENPDVSPKEWMDIAKYGEEKGVSNIEDAFFLYNRQKLIEKAREDGKKAALKELSTEATETLSEAGGSKLSEKEKDYDAMTPEEFGRLPIEEQKSALENAPSG